MALAYATGLSLILVPYLAYAYRTVALSLRRVIAELWIPLAGALALAPSLLLVKTLLPGDWPPAGRILVSAVAAGALFLAVVLMISPAVLRQTLGAVLMALRPRRRRELTGTY